MKDTEELTASELKQIAGGTDFGNPEPKYHVDQHLWEYANITMNYNELVVKRIGKYREGSGYEYSVCKLSDGTFAYRYLEILTNIFEYDPRV